MESSIITPEYQQQDDDDGDAAVMWEGLNPLFVEKIVDPLAPTFEARLLSTKDSSNNYRSFTVVQDREGRRRPAFSAELISPDDDVTAEEFLTENESRTGAVIWDGAVVAAGILDRAAASHDASDTTTTTAATEKERGKYFNPKGKKVIELGCGCAALPGMVATALGAEHVVLTDLEIIVESDVLSANLARNLCASEERCKVSKLAYRWGNDPLPLQDMQQQHRDDGGGFDLILACDTVYDMALVKPLLDSIELLMRNNDNDNIRECMALVCYDESIGRKIAYRFFQEEAKRRFDIVEHVTEAEKREDLTSDSVTAVRIMHPKKHNSGQNNSQI